MKRILIALRTRFPAPECALLHENPFQLLIATILSAQCTDERVNMVTPQLFAKYPTAELMAAAPVEIIADIIRSTGFFQNKSKNIKACCISLVEHHGGSVPRTMEELTALPGVGRKTANVVLGNAFGVPGFPVDTHVRRIANLLEFTDSENPEIIEKHLCAITPEAEWTEASHLFILHGRATCIARRPRCTECIILRDCPSAQR
ncbi:MAG: endonuclease III [Bacteroidetes bacterium]|nr:endonuclease III [Bacteroidota bacterium]